VKGGARRERGERGSARGGGARRGRFVVLEGVEGAGKTTQVRLLSAWLGAAGVPHVCAREPGGTHVGEAIRQVLLERRELAVPAETELLLMLAARAAFVREVVSPALLEGRVVLADRFDLSTFAYQGYGRGLDLAEVRRMNAFATGGVEPDLYVVLDLPVGEGTERQEREGRERDRIEREGATFLERVRTGYHALAEAVGHAQMVDARGAPESVHVRIRGLLGAAFPETFPTDEV
jgi:dTMP kinase